MISVIFLIFVSCFLDLFLSYLFSGIIPIFIICIIPLLSFSKYKFFIFLFIGFILDVLYSDVMFINVCFFLIMCFVSFKKSFLYLVLSSLFVYIFYIIYLFGVLNILGYGLVFDSLFSFFRCSFIINVIYIIIICLIFSRNLGFKKSLY